jgi:hypothetical protein
MYRYEKKTLVDVLIKYMCSKTAFFLLCRTMMSIDKVHTEYPSRNILFLSLFLLPRRFASHPTLILRMYDDDDHLTFIYASPIEKEKESARALRGYI